MAAMIQKLFVTPEQLRTDSYILASKVVKDNFEPDFMVGIWRGGAPIGICVHEFLKYKNILILTILLSAPADTLVLTRSVRPLVSTTWDNWWID